MKEDDITQSAIAILSQDPELKVLFSAEPQSIIMPFAKEHEKHYLVIVLFIIDQALRCAALASLCGRVVHLLKINRIIDGLDGLEVMPCIIQGGKTQRVLRLSVLSDAVEKAEELTGEEMRLSEPAKGVSCHIYLGEIA